MDTSAGHTASNVKPSFDSAAYSPAAHLRFWVVGVGLLFLDLWGKVWVFTHLKADEIRPIIPHTIDFRRSLNDGAVFGSFTGRTGLFVVASLVALGFVLYMFINSAKRQRVMQVALGLVFAGAIGNLYDRSFIRADVLTYRTTSGEPRSIIGKITGDDRERVYIGNWPDGSHPRSFRRSAVNIRRQGVVRDFIKFVPRFPQWAGKLAGRDIWPWVFNIADAALVCGVGLLLISSWLDRPTGERRASKEGADSAH